MMGDAGYDVETDNGTRGDSYFQATQPFSASWPSSVKKEKNLHLITCENRWL